MKKTEIICSTVLPADIDRSRAFVLRVLPAISLSATAKVLYQHLQRLFIGKCTALTVERFLRSHGIAHQSYPGHGLGYRAARFFFRIQQENVELKYVGLPDQLAKSEEILQSYALVPEAQWHKQRRISRYLFACYHGDLRIVISQSVAALVTGRTALTAEQISFKGRDARIFITAFPSLDECAREFKSLAACPDDRLQHIEPATAYRGCSVVKLTAFHRVVQWGGV